MSFETLSPAGILIHMDSIMTLAIASLLLLLGAAIKRRIPLLDQYCIPSPVVGGFLFMLFTWAGHLSGLFSFQFDATFQNPLMLAFFTTVGLGASFSLLKKGGLLLIIYWLICGVISILQNTIGIVISKAIGLAPPYGLLASAISMIGGHGAALSYGSTFVEMGYEAGELVGAAAATFGLISAVLIGGPLGRRLIVRHKLQANPQDTFTSDLSQVNGPSAAPLSPMDRMKNVSALLLCMAVGTVISQIIGQWIGMSFPSYVGSMFVAVLLRNLNESFHFYPFHYPLVDGIGQVSLSLYLSLALMTLKLWELSGLLGGVLLVVLAQVLFLTLAAYFVVFPLLGKNYDAAVMCAGLCGHSLGATPSAIVNMTAIHEQYGISRRAMMIVPIVGAFLVDLIYQPVTIWFIKTFVSSPAGG